MWLLVLLPCALGLRTLEPPPPTVVSRNEVIEGWVPVRLNHFDASSTDTFQMRYYYNPDTSGENNIVIFVGGEWSISPGWVTGGLPYDIASRAGAGVFYTEHRYYGLTRPTSETGVAELKYLNVDQALGDLAQFIEHVKSDDFEGGRYRNAMVGLVGCSYAGTMATWMKLGYPHLVTAAFSDSGPLHAQEDFPEYLEVITEALRVQGSEQCVQTVADAIDSMMELLTSEAGLARVSTLFNTCAPLQALSPLDRATFFWYGITETFAYLVQYAIPGDIPAACNYLTSGDPVERLGSWVSNHAWNQPCIESRYERVVAAHTNTSYDAPDSVMRLWTYQTCVEYGWYQTTTSSRQPFQSAVPLEYFHQMCRDFFPGLFTENLLRAGIERTNLLFAGLTHLPDHVISVAGGHDPWSPMGPAEEHATLLAPVYVVPRVSHCRAVRSLGDSETGELEDTKLAVVRFMVEQMTGMRDGAHTHAASKLVVAVVACLLLLVKQ